MKNQLLVIGTALMLTACEGASSENGNGKNNENTPVIADAVVVNYQLNAEESKADWNRTLDQKPTKQKVKLFGQMVDVDLGAVKLNSNGNATLTEGTLTETDGELTRATVVFDMSSFKLAKEKGNGLFDVTKHPNSTLVLTDISDKTAKGKLTIEGASKNMGVEITTTKTNKGHTLKGSFVVNTLDFPLRDKVTAKDVNKDEIKVDFELIYTNQ